MRPSAAKKNLTLPQQFLFLRNSKTAVGVGGLNHHFLEWNFVAQPTPMSREYQIHLKLKSDGVPVVRVIDPDLRLLSDPRDLPHIYHNPDTLCLYFPGEGQWDASKRLDLTIIPWTHLWLIYFEDWLVSDEWKGGGKHPGEGETPEVNRTTRRRLRR